MITILKYECDLELHNLRVSRERISTKTHFDSLAMTHFDVNFEKSSSKILAPESLRAMS